MRAEPKKMIETLCRVFKRLHYPVEIILVCVRWYVVYPLSLRHLEEMMAERGVVVDHSTIHRWAIKMLPVLAAVCRQRKRPVGRSWRTNQRIANKGCITWLTVGREPHELVFTRVDFEAAVRRECAVEQSQRVGIADFFQELDLRVGSDPQRASCPLAHTIDGEDCRAVERGRKEAACRVRHVVRGDQQPRDLSQARF